MSCRFGKFIVEYFVKVTNVAEIENVNKLCNEILILKVRNKGLLLLTYI
jgi:hypothetical protein